MVRKVESTGMPPEGEAGGSKDKGLSSEDKKTSRIGRKKAKEAEDIYKKPATPLLKWRPWDLTKEESGALWEHIDRKLGAPPKRKSFESGDSPDLAKDAIEQRQAVLWKCIGYELAPYGGRNYVYTIRYNSKRKQEEEMQKIFPAIEPLAAHVEEGLRYGGSEAVQKWLFKLGYKYECVPFKKEEQAEKERYLRLPLGKDVPEEEVEFKWCLYLPDQEALESGWKKLQEELPDLPDLDIHSSEGVASDIEFVEAYLTHDALLSSGKEFVHDSILHVIPALISLIEPVIPESKASGMSFVSKRKEIRKSIQEKYRRIMRVKREMEEHPDNFEFGMFEMLKDYFAQVEHHLGAVVDRASTSKSFVIEGTMDEAGFRTFMRDIFLNYNTALQDEPWRSKVKERFGINSDRVDWIEELHNLCDDVIRIIERRGITSEEPPGDE